MGDQSKTTADFILLLGLELGGALLWVPRRESEPVLLFKELFIKCSVIHGTVERKCHRLDFERLHLEDSSRFNRNCDTYIIYIYIYI